MDDDMVTGNEPTWVMRARARNAERFQMYVAASLRVEERDPHLRVKMVTVDSGIVYYQMADGQVLAFPMTDFEGIAMHPPTLYPNDTGLV